MTAARTYLDYNATAPLRIQARAAMLAALDLVGNPSSVHADGRAARAVVEKARTAVAALVGARAADIVFTSGATEANATVLAGGWDTIFLSDLEHDSVREAAKRSGARVVKITATQHGTVTADQLTGALDAAGGGAFGMRDSAFGKALVCLQYANNETGVVHLVSDVAAVAHAHGMRVHCDAVQAPGRVAVDVAALGVDYLTVSAHKLGGPKGVGALVIVDGAPLPSLIAGGGQERGRRAGTENVAAIAGFGAAAALAHDALAGIDHLRTLRDALERGVVDATPEAIIVGRDALRLVNTSCIALPGLAAETAVIRLDLSGVSVSAGAACSSGKVGHSTTLAAMGLAPEIARAAIRVSIGHATTHDDIAAFLAAWKHLTSALARAA